jgi:hypothetical protein
MNVTLVHYPTHNFRWGLAFEINKDSELTRAWAMYQSYHRCPLAHADRMCWLRIQTTSLPHTRLLNRHRAASPALPFETPAGSNGCLNELQLQRNRGRVELKGLQRLYLLLKPGILLYQLHPLFTNRSCNMTAKENKNGRKKRGSKVTFQIYKCVQVNLLHI